MLAASFPLFEFQSSTYIWNQLLRNGRHHRPHRSLTPAVSAAQLTANGHVTRNTGDHDDTPVFRSIGDHLLGGELGGEIRAHDVGPQKILVLLVGEVQEGDVSVDAGARNTDVKGIVEVGAELGEAFLQGVVGAHVDSIFHRQNHMSTDLQGCFSRPKKQLTCNAPFVRQISSRSRRIPRRGRSRRRWPRPRRPPLDPLQMPDHSLERRPSREPFVLSGRTARLLSSLLKIASGARHTFDIFAST
jgi:hypothetical protein